MTPAQCAMLERAHPALLGRALHLRRKALGLTQRQLANAAEVTAPYLSRLEAGERTPSPEVLTVFAATLQTPLDVLLGLSVDQAHPADVTDCLICGAMVRPDVAAIHRQWHGLPEATGKS